MDGSDLTASAFALLGSALAVAAAIYANARTNRTERKKVNVDEFVAITNAYDKVQARQDMTIARLETELATCDADRLVDRARISALEQDNRDLHAQVGQLRTELAKVRHDNPQ